MNMSPTRAVIALAPMIIALALAMDIYIPAVPSLAELFKAPERKMQLTLTLFMLSASIMQLFVGPLSDQLGRKKSAYIVILIFAVGTFLCGIAQSIEQLILFRILQAIGACGMIIIPFAVVRDKFHGRESAMIYSLLNGIIAFSPMFGPFIGSYIDVYLSWRSTFFSLLFIAALAFVFIIFILPETLPKSQRKRINNTVFKEYKTIITNKIFIIYNYAIAAGLSYLFIFFFISPYVIIRILHIPELQYGYYFFFMGVSFFLGSLLSAYLVKNIGIFNTVVIGFSISLVGGLLMTTWYFVTGLTINGFIWPMLLIGIGGTLGMGAGSGGAMEPFQKTAGAAASVSGFLRFSFSAGLGSIVVIKTISSSLPLAIPAVVLNIIGIILFLYYKKSLKISG